MCEGLCEGEASGPHLSPHLLLFFFRDSMWAMREVGENHLMCVCGGGEGGREEGERER